MILLIKENVRNSIQQPLSNKNDSNEGKSNYLNLNLNLNQLSNRNAFFCFLYEDDWTLTCFEAIDYIHTIYNPQKGKAHWPVDNELKPRSIVLSWGKSNQLFNSSNLLLIKVNEHNEDKANFPICNSNNWIQSNKDHNNW